MEYSQQDENKNEILLKENPNRFSILPIKYENIWNIYKNAESAIWHVSEVKLNDDLKDWIKLNENQKHFIKHVLAFFASSDGIVNENLSARFMNEIQIPEARCFYGVQIMMENIHAEMYAKMIDTYIDDVHERNKLLNAMHEIDCVKQKADWALKWITSNNIFAGRLLAFICVEGIFFSGSFCAIYWLNEQNLMKGLAKANDFIARDEGMHTDFACMLYSMIENKLSENEVHEIFNEAVNIELNFINNALPCSLLGMNKNLMAEYIKFVADRLLKQLNYNIIYNKKNPFEFMDRINLRNKSNFFEDNPSEYSKLVNNEINEIDPYADL